MASSQSYITIQEVGEGLARVIPRFRRGLDQMYVIAHVALEQHAIHAPYDTNACFSFHTKSKNDPFVMGSPINMAFYGGEAYLQFQYKDYFANKSDTLHRFYCTRDTSFEHAQFIVRKVYVMFRNILAYGTPPSHLESVFYGQITAVVSPFANMQTNNKLPMHMVKLVSGKR